MDGSRIVIAGGGMVAGYAAKQLVELGLKPGDLTIFSSDSALPYERPPLSKGLLAGKDTEESILINPPDFYSEHSINVLLNRRIRGIDAGRKRVILESGNEFTFDQLVLATGARVRTLDAPGSDLPNIQYLRSLSDSKTIRQQAEGAKHAVVIGGGFIGMEVAAVLAQKNIAVTMVLREDRIWQQFFSPQMSAFFESYYSARGVRIIKQAAIAGFRGKGSVNATLLKDGRTLDCDIVVAGVGVKPVIELFANSGIALGDGVIVNEFLEANVPGIYAAGDMANYFDVLFNKRRRVEHWDNAVSQGQHCAKILMGARTPFRHVPYFFSDVFDLSYEFWGDPAEASQIVHRGDLSTSSFSVWWLRDGVVVAAFVMNRPDEEREKAPQWIEAKQKVVADELQRESASLASVVSRAR